MSSQDDEIWTEEEVIEFGLAGEEEYCDLNAVETMPSDTYQMEVPTLDEVADSNVTKSGRVRKKSAKWVEMEESDELEKVIFGTRRGGRSTVNSRSTDEAFQFDINAGLQSAGDRQSKVHFSVGSSVESQPVSKGRSKKRKKSENEGEMDYGEEFGIGEPTSFGHEPLRMKLSAVGDSKDLVVTRYGQQTASPHDSPQKSAKSSRRKGTFDGATILSSSATSSLQSNSFSLGDEDSEGECDVTGYVPPRGRQKKLQDADALQTLQDEVNLRSQNLLSIKTEGSADTIKNISKQEFLQQKPTRTHASPRKLTGKVPQNLAPVIDGEGSTVIKHLSPQEFLQQQPSFERQQKASRTSVSARKLADKSQKKKRQKGYTAYMLWCSTQRHKVIAANTAMDFSTLSKRLGDMWQTVPEKQKITWRKKARRLSKKGIVSITSGRVPVVRDGPARRGRPPSLHRDVGRSLYGGNKMIKLRGPDDLTSANFRVVGTGPLDAAAHLKLLGESLTVIGARLQEHKGQIAVQGSLSVLLDSMLCALGPLMCLTSQIPELSTRCEQLQALHTDTLNNIAYVMPGVG